MKIINIYDSGKGLNDQEYWEGENGYQHSQKHLDAYLCGLGSGRSNLLENQGKAPKSTSISILIDQFSCKNWLIKDGGC